MEGIRENVEEHKAGIKLRITLIIVLATLVCCIPCESIGLELSDKKYTLVIPSSIIQDALIALARATGHSVVIPSAEGSAERTHELNGTYTLSEALTQMLKDTHLSGDLTESGVITISRSNKKRRSESMNSKKNLLASVMGFLFSSQSAQLAQAEQYPSAGWVLEEVVVTAQKREESMQSVPIAISAFDDSALENMGFTDFSDMMNKVPALTIGVYPQGSSALVMSIRGIGQVDAAQIATDPGVGIYLDDVYLARGQALTSELGEVERIEVLRGPQGTLYGRNTVGGAVKFITAKPTGEFGFKEDINLGKFGLQRLSTYLNLPEFAQLSTKLSYLKSDFDGWVDNPGGENFGKKDAEGYRVDLRWQPSDEVTLDYAYDYSDQNGTSLYQQRAYAYLFPDYHFPLQADPVDTSWRSVELPHKDDFRASGHAITAIWNVSPNTTLKSITAYRSLKAEQIVDTVEAFNIVSVNAAQTYQHQFSQEILLLGDNSDLALRYNLGMLYFRESGEARSRALTTDVFTLSAAQPFVAPSLNNLGPLGANEDVENVSVGLYTNITWIPGVVDERLSFTLGARYSSDTRDAKKQGLDPGHTTYHSWDPSITLDYEWSDAVHSYVKYAEAYRSGGFNLRSSSLAAFAPEQLDSTEVGFKSMWWNNRLKVNLALFSQNYTDIQLTFTQVGTNVLNVQTVNAGENTTKGVELDVTVSPIENLIVTANVSYLDAENVEAENPFTGVPIPGGFPRTYTSPWAYYVSGEYTFAELGFGTLSAFIDYSFSDEQQMYSGTATDLRPDYSLVNARLTVSDISLGNRSTLSISLWGKNLADEDYQLYHAFGGVIFGEPRSYGLQARFEY
jgi:iron complex outermembrane recepter protein